MVQANKEGNTLIHFAAKQGNSDYIRFLSPSKEELNYQNNNGHTPLHIAYMFDQTEAAWQLELLGADQTIVDKNGRTPKEVKGLGER